MKSSLFFSALLGQSFAYYVSPPSNSSQSTNAACQELLKLLPGKVALKPASSYGAPASYGSYSSNSSSLSTLYNTTQQSYWDSANTDDSPPCMVFPSCADEVSTVVKTLNKYPATNFALKSGGHNWNAGFSATNEGVLISFRPNFQNVSLNANKSVAEVQPGAKWKDVMGYLNQYERCAVGGRVDDVGVGGYVILGGISYLSGQWGYSADNVVNFEVVTAKGEIVNANATHNADLYFSLRGGANNFGIVTKYSLIAHPIGKVWSGDVTYSEDKIPKLMRAMAKWTANFNTSMSKAHLLPGFVFSPLVNNGTPQVTMTLFWDGPSPPDSVFADFLNIPHLNNTITTKTYPEALHQFNADVNIGRTVDRVGSYANLPIDDMTDFMVWHYNQMKNSSLRNDSKAQTHLLGMTPQPIPVDQQKANGVGIPGALHVDPAGGDKIFIEYSYAWANPSEDARVKKALEDLVNEAQEYQRTKYAGVKPTNYKSGKLPEVYQNPLFANDAAVGQPIFTSYGNATYKKMVDTRKKFDPEQFFQKRTNGFHLELEQELAK